MKHIHRGIALVGIICFALLAAATPAPAQKNNKKQKADQDAAANTPMPKLPLPDVDQIDQAIGQMLGAFQVGNVEMMHKYYADNATFVRGSFDPPVSGWQNYAPLYQVQRAAFAGMDLIRRNTNIFVHGDVAWVSYQWELLTTYVGKPYSARGQTTLVLSKLNGNWLIVHNHTSQICDEQPGPVPQQAKETPAPANPVAADAPKPDR